MDLHTSEVGGPKSTGASLEGLVMRAVRDPSLITHVRPRHLAALPQAAKMSVVKQKRLREMKRWEEQFDKPDPFEQAVFDQLLQDPDFYRQFEDDPTEPA